MRNNYNYVHTFIYVYMAFFTCVFISIALIKKQYGKRKKEGTMQNLKEQLCLLPKHWSKLKISN